MILKKIQIGNLLASIRLHAWQEHRLGKSESFIVPKYIQIKNPPDLEFINRKGYPYIYVDESSAHIRISGGIVRQNPLFYLMDERQIHISDNPTELKEIDENNASTLEHMAMLEFLAFGYTIGSRTLLSGIYQVQAGEVIEIDNNGVEAIDEFIYDTASIYDISENELKNRFENMLFELFQEAVNQIDGKTVLVPLSGGYDSRLLAAMLKLVGYENVICLNYGIPRNTIETPPSELAASKLDYKWIHVEYSIEKWLKTLQSDIFTEYTSREHKYSSIPQIHEMPFLIEINKKFGNPEDFVIIPGHSADFLAGSHIPINIIKWKQDKKFAVRRILKKQYKFRHGSVHCDIRKNIEEQVEKYSKYTSDSIRFFHIFDWRERQAKIIANSNREYEFFGYRWLMPFWDREFVDFWSAVPFHLRFAKKLYEETIEERIFARLGLDFDSCSRADSRRRKAGILRRFGSDSLIRLYKKVLGRGYVNPIGLDVSNPNMLKLARDRFPKGYNKLKTILARHFPAGYGLSPHVYETDYIMSMLMEEFSR